MKNKALIFLLLALSVFSCDKEDISEGQSESFIKFFTNYSEFSAADVVTLDEGGYAVLGTVSTPDDGTQICLLMTNEYGNTLDSVRIFGQAMNDVAYGLIRLRDGGFAILGSSQNTVNLRTEVYFIRTNTSGDTLWTRKLSVSGNMEPRSFDVDTDENFYITGYRDDISLLGRQIFIAGINNDGSSPWSIRDIGLRLDDEGTHIQILSNGYMAITGRTKNMPSAPAEYRSFILLTNTIGLQENWMYVPSDVEEEGTCIRALDANNYLVLSSIKNSTGSLISLKQVNMSRLEVTWNQQYGITGRNIGKSVLVNGSIFYILGTTGSTGTNTAISVIAADADGTEISRSDFGLGTELSGSSFERTSDGGFIIVGTNTNPEENNTSVALIKTHPDITL